MRDGLPSVGVIFVPATGVLYAGVGRRGRLARRRSLTGRSGARQAIRVRAGAGRTDRRGRQPVPPHARKPIDHIARYEVGRLVSAGSSLKFCVVAAGEADLYPRMGTTMQWDTAAGEAILRAAGGKVVTLEGTPLSYGPGAAEGSDAFRNPWFIATGGMDPILS